MTVSLHVGDARSLPLADASVHCIATSPPYHALRDYGNAPGIWGGTATCDHDWKSGIIKDRHGDDGSLGNLEGSRAGQQATRGDKSFATCSLCGAWRGQLGAEPLHDCLAWAKKKEPCAICYVCHLRTVAREWWRVLRKDGTLWLNLGDSNAASGKGPDSKGAQSANAGSIHGEHTNQPRRAPAGLKPKDLEFIPQRVALALQSDGWWGRNDIIWHKLAPMPFPATDRYVYSYEHVFLLTKSKSYYFDWHAAQEPSVSSHGSGNGFKREERLVATDENGPRGNDNPWEPTSMRCGRDVWTLPPEQFDGAHFAVMPTEIARRAIIAGTSEHGCCSRCGAPYKREFEIKTGPRPESWANSRFDDGKNAATKPNIGRRDYEGKNLDTDSQSAGRRLLSGVRAARAAGADHDNPFQPRIPIGWKASCKCKADIARCRVLDTFCGSGTVPMVAESLGRDGVGVDANERYVREIATPRTAQMGLALRGAAIEVNRERPPSASSGHASTQDCVPAQGERKEKGQEEKESSGGTPETTVNSGERVNAGERENAGEPENPCGREIERGAA